MKKLIDLINKHVYLVEVGVNNCDMNLVVAGVNFSGTPEKEELVTAIKEAKGTMELDLLDGSEHSYLEVGAWMSDQGDALRLMALLSKLEITQLNTPYTVLGESIDAETAKIMAGQGFVTVIINKGEKITAKSVLEKSLKKHEWSILSIHPTDDEASPENHFIYTIGLTELGLPELFLSGNLNPQSVAQIFHTIVDEWKENGPKMGITHDYAQSKEGKDLPMEIVEIEHSDELINDYAVQLFHRYKGNQDEIKVAQVLWCDIEGNLPSSPDFSMHDKLKLFNPVTKSFQA